MSAANDMTPQAAGRVAVTDSRREKMNIYQGTKERAIQLVSLGEYIEVRVDIGNGKWATVIRERADGAYSHIVCPSAIRRAIQNATLQDTP